MACRPRSRAQQQHLDLKIREVAGKNGQLVRAWGGDREVTRDPQAGRVTKRHTSTEAAASMEPSSTADGPWTCTFPEWRILE